MASPNMVKCVLPRTLLSHDNVFSWASMVMQLGGQTTHAPLVRQTYHRGNVAYLLYYITQRGVRHSGIAGFKMHRWYEIYLWNMLSSISNVPVAVMHQTASVLCSTAGSANYENNSSMLQLLLLLLVFLLCWWHCPSATDTCTHGCRFGPVIYRLPIGF